MSERDAFLAVLDPMPPAQAGPGVYGDGWADTYRQGPDYRPSGPVGRFPAAPITILSGGARGF